ncbi:hypothetical protein BDR03DRAFT_981931 [Suillus americanus]|nr:hypothetical protein BDR03DRAFT_981931 [Suillus americanus]
MALERWTELQSGSPKVRFELWSRTEPFHHYTHHKALLGQRGQHDISPGTWDDLDNMGYNEHPSLLDTNVPECIDPIFQVDNIKREYHPSSGMASEVNAFDNFKCHPTPSTSSMSPNKHPWALFKSRLKFEITELALERLSKFDGKTFIHFVDEPFTANTFWNVQGVGGGYVVGWLLIVKEDRDHASKPSWVNFKNAVWHESFIKILSSLASKSHTGQWFECLDNVQCWFFPFILILSADYEEQCIMSLIQGIKCLWPCPVCLVPHDELMNTLECYPYQTSAQFQEVLQAAWAKQTAKEKEEKMKEYGLCDLINAFATVMYTDVHDVLSWDRLHFNGENHRQFGMNESSASGQKNLKHLAQIMSISFADSSVYEDISKMVIHTTHTILTEDECPLGYLLLCCIRLFLELDTHAALQVHTTETISASRHAIQAFLTYLQQYIDKSADKSNKNWNFPKLHILHINHWQVAAESIWCHISDLDEYES